MIGFKERIETPEIWFQQSWEMFEASKVIYESFSNITKIKTEKDNQRQVGLMKSAMLMLGLATENSLKGALVYKSKPNLSNNKLDPKFFHKNAHDLRDVASKLELNLSKEDEALLDRLSIFVNWAAKYKSPLKQTDYEKDKNNIKLQFPSDFDKVEKLINILQIQSGYSTENGWPYKS